jgi:hypothetical protein
VIIFGFWILLENPSYEKVKCFLYILLVNDKSSHSKRLKKAAMHSPEKCT